MQINTPDFERLILRLGSMAFLAGLVIIIVSTIFHPPGQPATNYPLVFTEYAASKTWIAVHIGQFAGVMLVFAGGFVALYHYLASSESSSIGGLGILAGTATIILGVGVAYVGFASQPIVADLYDGISFTLLIWLVVLGIFMWKKSMTKMIAR
jgi:hypothetical protein